MKPQTFLFLQGLFLCIWLTAVVAGRKRSSYVSIVEGPRTFCDAPVIVEQMAFEYNGDFANITVHSCDPASRVVKRDLMPLLDKRDGCHILPTDGVQCQCSMQFKECDCGPTTTSNGKPVKGPKPKDCLALATILSTIIPQQNGPTFVIELAENWLVKYGTCSVDLDNNSFGALEFCFSDVGNTIAGFTNTCMTDAPVSQDVSCFADQFFLDVGLLG